MVTCHTCKKEVGRKDAYAVFYTWTFHLGCFVEYTRTHLIKPKVPHNNDHVQDGA